MDDKAARTRVLKKNLGCSATVYAISLRIIGSLVAMVMLLWAVCSGFELARDSSRYTAFADWAFYIGIVTMIFGFLFLILGVPIVADLFLNLSKQLQEDAGIRKGINTDTNCSEISPGSIAV